MCQALAFALGSALAPGNTWLALPSAERNVECAHAQSSMALLYLYLRGAFKIRSCVNFRCTGKEHSVERQQSLKPCLALPFTECVTFHRSLDLNEHHFSHSQNKDNSMHCLPHRVVKELTVEWTGHIMAVVIKVLRLSPSRKQVADSMSVRGSTM